MDYTVFKKLGLNDKEIKIYLTLLEKGSLSVRGLAAITELNRGTVYDILKDLQSEGLVSYFHLKTKQQFVAEDPEKLLKYTEDKEKEIQSTKEKLRDMMPELHSLVSKEGNKPVTKFYEGKSGIKSILEDVIGSQKANDEYFVYSATHASVDWKMAYPNFTKDRIKKKIKVKAISLAEGGNLSGLDERKWLGTHDESATFIMIYANKCAFISRDSSGNPVGVIILNKMIFETQKIIFLQLWKYLK
jgi:HTH-type transcriptional regulator, sugar sensing transcriptional regulator